MAEGRRCSTVLVALALLMSACSNDPEPVARRRPKQAVVSPSPVAEAPPVAAPEPPPPAPEPGAADVAPSSTVVKANGDDIVVRSEPRASSGVKATLHGFNDVGQQQTLLVVGEQAGWFEVLLPIRPNGTTGWVAPDQVKSERVSHYLVAILGQHKLEHYVDGRRAATYPVATGKARTPTPTGLFYVWATQKNPGGVYNPVIFALSGFSPTLLNWPGGGRVGIHGWPDPSVLGKSVSNGCLRLQRADAAKLSATIPLGTPVRVIE